MRRGIISCFSVCLFVMGWLMAQSPSAKPTGKAEANPKGVQQFLQKHCLECHGMETQKADLRLDTLGTDWTNADTVETWKAVAERVHAGTMPPAKKPRPRADEIEILTGFVQTELAEIERARQKKEGRVVLRRLNRDEYENTVRDLLGVSVDVKELLPADALSHGFDNIGEALSISPIQMQRYLQAAELGLNSAIATSTKPPAETKVFSWADGRAKNNIGRFWLKRDDGAVVVFKSGTFPSTQIDAFRAWAPGQYHLKIQGYAFQSPKPIAFALYYGNFGRGGETILEGYHEFMPGDGQIIEVSLNLRQNDSIQILPYGIDGLNPYRKPNPDKPEDYRGPGLALQSVTFTGPEFEQWPPRGHQLLFDDLPLTPLKLQPKGKEARGLRLPVLGVVSKQPEQDAKRLLPGFIRQAFRRPVSDQDCQPYLELFNATLQDGASFQEAMQTAAAAVLCSPDFLFLREQPGPLDDYALASRLSYFLWRTMPDGELWRLAQENKLHQPAILKAQTERLLRHPNADRFTRDFTNAWLDLRNIDFTVPDKLLYPEFDNLLQDSMLLETRAFFGEVLNKNLPSRNFVQSNFAMLNSRLASHYGLPAVNGLDIRRVQLPANSVRGGLLSQGAILKVSANGTNTSPVVRGVYVLERFLGVVPPPPPPGVPAVEPDIRGANTVRELLAKHRNSENCAGCHRLIDPPGFALECFDVIGGWRDQFRAIPDKPGKNAVFVDGKRMRYVFGQAVDASGEFNDGRSFQNFAEFRAHLLQKPEVFANCLTKKLVTFATGQDVGLAEQAEIKQIVASTKQSGYGFRDLIHAVVQSELFRTK